MEFHVLLSALINYEMSINSGYFGKQLTYDCMFSLVFPKYFFIVFRGPKTLTFVSVVRRNLINWVCAQGHELSFLTAPHLYD